MNSLFNNKLTKLLIGACALFSAVSCVKDSNSCNDSQVSGTPVKVEISFRVPKFSYPQSSAARASVDDGDAFNMDFVPAVDMDSIYEEKITTRAATQPLYNLWVFQFLPDGTKRKAVRVSTNDKPIYENQTIEVELLTGSNQTIYMVALGKQYGDVDLSGIKSLTELERTSLNFVRYENGLPVSVIQTADDVPYRGSCDNLSIIKLEESGAGYIDFRNSPGFSGSISMTALVSLISIDFSYVVDKMTPFCISLNNVPATFAVNANKYKPSQFVNLSTIQLNPADFTDGKRKVFSWYAAPNNQGTVPAIKKETDRYAYYKTNSTIVTGTAPIDGTYIHIWASSNTTANNYALYYLFVGGNTTDDFNVKPHSHYRYRTDINTADDINDKRIIFKVLKQTIDMGATAFISSSNGYTTSTPSGSRQSASYDFDAHPDMRPIEITALRGNLTVEVIERYNSTSPIDVNNSWLKLSTYPNYTAALEGQRSGDAMAMTTSATFDVKIPGLFRLYLYSDEYENYVTDNPDDHKRTLMVRFTFKTDTDKTETYIARMDQRPGFYMGQYGGEFVKDPQGQAYYTKGLVMDAKTDKMQLLSYYPSSWSLQMAYISSIIPNETQKKCGSFDYYNGRRTTIITSENTYSISPIATVSSNIQEPRYVGGHVDLYQYKYYTGDGFYQRWCYDKNRDTNGDGYLSDDEIIWYVPAPAQAMSAGLNYYTTYTEYLRSSSFPKSVYSTNASTLSGMAHFCPRNLIQYSYGTVEEPRCVRDVEIPSVAGLPGGIKYYVENGYAVIDATGLMDGVAEDRVNNTDVKISPSDHPDGKAEYVGRVKRHYIGDYDTYHVIDRKVSKRFRVAPRDVDAAGKMVTKRTNVMWAQAAGYDPAVNTLSIVDGVVSEVAESGCPAYKGKDNEMDPANPNKWRLPTVREAMLISMMDDVMYDTNANTGYARLYHSNDNFFSYYWTATEMEDTGTSESYKNRAVCIGSSAKFMDYAPTGSPNYRSVTNNNKTDTYNVFVRCIQDL